ncbi:glycosyltransferase family 1 protein [Silvibacterium dinghuense]|uniref:Glycosyltransferase family 1 protein n=2 Tax=Silvibacterium dinghuense TaxID=1560006 RepID=A0A4Q1SKI5_9BACT|nr:glycosyltransferase family 1 protein [Silvibacterium dinghuense]
MRVAYFPDSFHEINGVAHTSRHFAEYARRRNLPFLCIRAGELPTRQTREGEFVALDLHRGLLSFPLDKGLSFDPAYVRHLPLITTALREFRPDLIHITGPSENGLLGAALAHHLGLPLAASWHTNVHEYAARRSGWFLRMLPKAKREPAAARIEHLALLASAKFYSLAKVLFAPNPGLCALLEKHTHRPCRLMQRGVDTQLFSPAHRDRRADDTAFVLGFVGRLSIEKNVALLAEVQKGLAARGITNFRFCVVGQGAEEAWLRENLPGAEFTGVLRGEALSRAYANMDLFVFPSHTDTFGNVVLEALASGVPAVVTPDGGPASIIQPGVTGLVAPDEAFPAAVASLIADLACHAAMREEARIAAGRASWDSVFDAVYQGYRDVLCSPAALPEPAVGRV